MPPEPALDTTVQGRCYCGGVRFTVRVPADTAPIFTAYCHCDSCRRAHAAPLYQVVCIDREHLHIDEGVDLLQDYQRTPAAPVRSFCRACGTRIHNTFGDWKPKGRTPLVFFPSLLEPSDQARMPPSWVPRHHNEPESCVLEWDFLTRIQPG